MSAVAYNFDIPLFNIPRLDRSPIFCASKAFLARASASDLNNHPSFNPTLATLSKVCLLTACVLHVMLFAIQMLLNYFLHQ